MAVYFTQTYYDCIDKAAELAASFGASPKNKTVVFCEDKLTLSLEQSLSEKTGGFFSASVTSFGRYIQKNLRKRRTLSKAGAAIAVKKIVSASADELSALGRLGSSPTFAAETSELIAQLKSAKVTPELVAGCVPSCPAGAAAKIGDIALIFRKYEEFLAERGLGDSSGGLDEMADALKNEDLSSVRVIIAGFSSVTAQSREVIKILYEKSLSCDFIAVTGDNDFLYSGEFAEFALRLTSEKPVTVPTSAEKVAYNLLSSIYRPEYLGKDAPPAVYPQDGKIRVYEGEDPSDEVSFVAAYIRREIIEKGLRYKDFAVSVGNLSEYSLLIKRVFSDYNIPFYADEKRPLRSHPLARLCFDAVRAAARRGDISDIKKIFLNSTFMPDKRNADKFLSDLTERSLTFKTVFSDYKSDDVRTEEKKNALFSFINSFPRAASAETYVSLLKDFLISVGSDENVAEIAERLAAARADDEKNFLLGAIDDLYSVLDQISDILGKDPLTGEEFYKLLLSGADATDISLIQRSADCVFIGEMKDLRYHKYRYLYAIGLNGDVPTVKNDVALLTDGDISRLERLSVFIEPKIKVVNRREKEASALALASFTDRLVLSYSLVKPSGTPVSKSEILVSVINAFALTPYGRKSIEKRKLGSFGEKLDELLAFSYLAVRPSLLSLASDGENFRSGKHSDLSAAAAFIEALKTYEGGKYEEEAIGLFDGSDASLPEKIPVSQSDFFRAGTLSASLLEKFYACPYSCFLSYAVALKETASADIKTNNVGTLFHSVAEKFVKERLSSVKDEDDCKNKAREVFEEVFSDEKYTRFLSRADYRFGAEAYKKEAEKLCFGLYEESKISLFKPVATEIRFGQGGEYPAIRLKTPRGEFRITGFADRLDRYGKYVRVIDYKTGNAKDKADEKKFYTGRNIQLYLYMNALIKDGDVPAGAYYYSVSDKFLKEDETPPFMYGKTLSDEEVLNATDGELLLSGKSRFVSGNPSRPGNAIVENGVFGGYMKYALILAEKAVGHIAGGRVGVFPYKGACDYCEFRAICGFDEGSGKKCRTLAKRVKTESITGAADSFAEKNPPRETEDNI